jgi:hypothetical protein
MKMFFLTLVLSLSTSAFAQSAWTEVECTGKTDTTSIYFEVEQAFPTGSSFKRSVLRVTENGAEKSFESTVISRFRPIQRLEYWGGGVRLEVDLWPDQRPRWGMTYQATFRGPEVTGHQRMKCRFPNIF